jgi:hypothetical protein
MLCGVCCIDSIVSGDVRVQSNAAWRKALQPQACGMRVQPRTRVCSLKHSCAASDMGAATDMGVQPT